MKEFEIIKDILQYRVSNEIFYNDRLTEVRNPEVRQVLTQLRDDEMRAIVELQQKEQRYQSSPGIITRIFPGRPKN